MEILGIAKKELDKLYFTHQRVSDIKAGIVYKWGIYLPLQLHRIFYEGYIVQFLSTFINFFSAMLNGEENLFKEFAIRTIAEMGMKDSQILFSPDISENEKEKFKTIIILADYGFLSFHHPERKIEYMKLFDEQKRLLSLNQLSLFTKMSKCLDTRNYDEYKKLIKPIRKLVDSTRNDLYKKTTTPKIFRTENIEAMFSAFSHLIHGNIILLTDVLSAKRPKNRNRLRISWTLLMTGMNTLIHVNDFLNKNGVKLETGDLFKRFKTTSKEIANYWRSIEGEKVNMSFGKNSVVTF